MIRQRGPSGKLGWYPLTMHRPEDDVLAANEAFYLAFRDRDADTMERLWAEDEGISCIHPGMRAILGREAVIKSWRGILGHPEAPAIACTDAHAHIFGTSALVTCLEGVAGEVGSLAATNAFVLRDGAWLLVHHQAGPLTRDARRRTRSGTDDFDLTHLN